MLNRDIFALKSELDAIKADVQRLNAWLQVSVGRIEKRLEALEIQRASDQASAMTASVLKRPILSRAKT